MPRRAIGLRLFFISVLLPLPCVRADEPSNAGDIPPGIESNESAPKTLATGDEKSLPADLDLRELLAEIPVIDTDADDVPGFKATGIITLPNEVRVKLTVWHHDKSLATLVSDPADDTPLVVSIDRTTAFYDPYVGSIAYSDNAPLRLQLKAIDNRLVMGFRSTLDRELRPRLDLDVRSLMAAANSKTRLDKLLPDRLELSATTAENSKMTVVTSRGPAPHHMRFTFAPPAKSLWSYLDGSALLAPVEVELSPVGLTEEICRLPSLDLIQQWIPVKGIPDNDITSDDGDMSPIVLRVACVRNALRDPNSREGSTINNRAIDWKAIEEFDAVHAPRMRALFRPRPEVQQASGESETP